MSIYHPLLVYFMLLWISIFFTGVVFSATPHKNSSENSCSPKERNSLLQFKAKLLDPNGILSSWTEGDCCRWKGVGCDESGVVVKLDLHNPNATDPSDLDNFDFYNFDFYNFDFYSLGLSGEINPSLLSLHSLQHLDLSGNNFSSSPFPSFIGSFKELRYLNLSVTGLVGVIPSRFANLTSLEFLDLSYNNELRLEATQGLSFLTHLSSLQYIDMSRVNLSVGASDLFQVLNSLPFISVINLENCGIPSIPESLFPQLNFKNLTVLSLSKNYDIFGEFKIPDWLLKINTLEHLDLEYTNSNTFSSREPSIIPVAIGDLYRLKFLALSGNSLSGSIPDSIGNMSLLQEIRLNDNKLVGSIPESLGRGMSSLRRLDFSNNKLDGSIPESVGRIQSLQQLHLSDNILGGPIPTSVGNLSSLRELNLQGNQLTGPIPSSLGMLKSLEILDLSKNSFNGSIPESLCDLEFLRLLDLSWNDEINGSIPDCVWGLERIETLGFGGEGLQGVLSESHLSKLYRLESLTITASKSIIVSMPDDWIPPFSLLLFYMYSCKVGPKFPMWLRTQNKLKILVLDDVGLSEDLPIWIWNFSSKITYIMMPRNDMKGKLVDTTYAPLLFGIDLSYNKFEGSNWLSNISKMMPNMDSLSIAANKFSGTIPSSLCSLNLHSLDLSANNFSGEIPGCLKKVWTNLNMASNNLSGGFPAFANGSSQCYLKSLYLNDNNLSGALPASLKNCSDLTILDVGHNRFTGNVPAWIGESMSSLKILSLRSNRFSGSIPAVLFTLSYLQILDLSNNNVSGTIPSSIGNLTAMKYKHMNNGPMYSISLYGSIIFETNQTVSVVTKGREMSYTKILSMVTIIDLSGNGLSGVIPAEVGDLHGLGTLNLSFNHLSGGIPETISRLKALETLDLSSNDLSGEIPQGMSTMTTLNNLNLSFNNLSGRIPVGNQFSTFTDASIFIGNPYLCGSPLKNCGDEQKPTSVQKQRDGGDENEKIWFYLCTVLGFIAGFWLFYGVLFFKRKWRDSYFQLLDKFNKFLYVNVAGRLM